MNSTPDEQQPKQPHNQQLLHSLIKQVSGQSRVLTIPRLYVDLTGDHVTALVLSQIVFWSDRAGDNDGWFAKSYSEWHDELALSQYQVNRAVKVLAPFGVETKLRRSSKHKGGAVLNYRVDIPTLTNLIIKKLDNQETSQSHHEETSQSIIEMTSDETPVSTKDVETGVAPPKKPRKTPPHDAHYHALIEAFGYTHEGIPKTLQGTYGMAAAQIYKCGVTLEDVPRLYSYVKRLSDEQHWTSFTVMALVNRVPDFLRDRQNGQSADHHKIDGYRIIT